MYPFVKAEYITLDVDKRKEICSLSYRICTATATWTAQSKQKILELLESAMESWSVIRRDLGSSYEELQNYNPIVWVPSSILEYIRVYFSQFYTIKDKHLCLPSVQAVRKPEVPKPVVQPKLAASDTRTATKSTPKVKAILDEVWWVVRVKSEYRMCRLTFDRGEYWEMVAYKGTKVQDPRYKFPKYDNRVVYEFREHITPDMFDVKIAEAVQIRKAALQAQAQKLLLRYDTVLIARHLTGGTLVGGVEEETDTCWYLDTYNEQGDHVFYGDSRWELEKKSRCTVVQILRRK